MKGSPGLAFAGLLTGQADVAVGRRFYATPRADGSADPRVREFLRFILSRDAQVEVARDTTMLPLTADEIVEERKKLD